MKKYIYLYLILILSIQLLAQDNSVIKKFEGKVEYISSQFLYVQFGNTEGLNSGDTLYTKKKGKYRPQLIIESLSSRSCATKAINKPVGIGTEIFGFKRLELILDEDSNKTLITPKPPIDNLVKVDTAEYIGFKKLDNGLYDAMNKGIKLATGDVVGILNSDDFYIDEFVIAKVVKVFEEKEVELVEIGGSRSAFGHNDLVNGSTTQDANKKEAMQLLKSKNFKDK